jgi:hypothetical protein
VSVAVCRGCCCGDARVHPGVDHHALLADLVRRLGERARVRAVECLATCEEGNVVVVSPTPRDRRSGTRPVWIGRVLSPAVNERIVEWVEDGGPGRADPPEELRELIIRPGAVAARGRGR